MAYEKTVDTTFLETPADGNQAGYGAAEIRGDKLAWVERLRAEHELDPGIGGDQARHGLHRQGSAVAYVVTALPTKRADGVTDLSTDVSKTLDDGLLVVLLAPNGGVGAVHNGLYVRRASTLPGGVNEPAAGAPGVLHKGWVRVSDVDFIGPATKDAGVTVEGVKFGGASTDSGFIQSSTGVILRGGKQADTPPKNNVIPGETAMGKVTLTPLSGASDDIVLVADGSIRVKSVRYTGGVPEDPVDGQEWFVS